MKRNLRRDKGLAFACNEKKHRLVEWEKRMPFLVFEAMREAHGSSENFVFLRFHRKVVKQFKKKNNIHTYIYKAFWKSQNTRIKQKQLALLDSLSFGFILIQKLFTPAGPSTPSASFRKDPQASLSTGASPAAGWGGAQGFSILGGDSHPKVF